MTEDQQGALRVVLNELTPKQPQAVNDGICALILGFCRHLRADLSEIFADVLIQTLPQLWTGKSVETLLAHTRQALGSDAPPSVALVDLWQLILEERQGMEVSPPSERYLSGLASDSLELHTVVMQMLASFTEVDHTIEGDTHYYKPATLWIEGADQRAVLQGLFESLSSISSIRCTPVIHAARLDIDTLLSITVDDARLARFRSNVPLSEDQSDRPRDERPLVILIESLQYIDRPLMWRLAQLVSFSDEPLLIVWTGESRGYAKTFIKIFESQGQLSHVLRPAHNDEAWMHWSQQVGRGTPLLHSSTAIRDADLIQEALLMEHTSPVDVDQYEQPGDLEVAAALLGSTFPLRPLSILFDLSVYEIFKRLSNLNFISIGRADDPTVRFRFPNSYLWARSLIASTHAPKAWHAKLRRGLQELPRSERWIWLDAEERLQGEVGDQFTAPAEDYFLKETDGLLSLISAPQIHPLSLTTLIGAALEWGQWGPKWGHWQQTLSALQIGVAAARSLGQLSSAAECLLKLGECYLKLGSGQAAEQTLALSNTLSTQLKYSYLMVKSQLLRGEAALLEGKYLWAIKCLHEIEHMEDTELPELIWQAKFRRAQLLSQMDQPRAALEIWSTLHEESLSVQMEEALYIEEVRAQLMIRSLDEASMGLTHIQPNRLSEALSIQLAVCLGDAELVDAIDQIETVCTQASAQRDISTWIYLRRTHGMLILELISVEPTVGLARRVASIEGLNKAVKVTQSMRDRVTLYQLHLLLGDLYSAGGDVQQSALHWALAESWKLATDVEYLNAPTQRLGLLKSDGSDEQLVEDARKTSREEVNQRTLEWRETRLDGVKAKASQPHESAQ